MFKIYYGFIATPSIESSRNTLNTRLQLLEYKMPLTTKRAEVLRVRDVALAALEEN